MRNLPRNRRKLFTQCKIRERRSRGSRYGLFQESRTTAPSLRSGRRLYALVGGMSLVYGGESSVVDYHVTLERAICLRHAKHFNGCVSNEISLDSGLSCRCGNVNWANRDNAAAALHLINPRGRTGNSAEADGDGVRAASDHPREVRIRGGISSGHGALGKSRGQQNGPGSGPIVGARRIIPPCVRLPQSRNRV
jgi:hypothetical protein